MRIRAVKSYEFWVERGLKREAMKKKYLNLEFCLVLRASKAVLDVVGGNGIPLRALRMNSIEVLDLLGPRSSFLDTLATRSPCASHLGMPFPEDSKEAAMEFANRGMPLASKSLKSPIKKPYLGDLPLEVWHRSGGRHLPGPLPEAQHVLDDLQL